MEERKNMKKNIEGKVEEESYPIALNEDGSRITLIQMKSSSELAKLPDEVKYKKNEIYVIIPLNNEAEPEYITASNNTYKLYGNGTLKALGEKTVNSGYSWNEVNNNLNEYDGLSLVLLSNGEVYGIGKNDYGQLGTGDSIGRTEFARCTKLEE